MSGRAPLTESSPRLLLAGAAAALLLLLVVATQCESPGPVPIDPPTGAAADCPALRAALPDVVNGQSRRRTSPESGRTEAWGSPPVILRCGVEQPPGLTPTSEVIEVNGVGWFLDEREDAYVFTTVGRQTYVEAHVPLGIPRDQATGPLVDLARPIKMSVPLE